MKNNKNLPKEKSTFELLQMKDEDIDCSDIPELDEEFWKNAKLYVPKQKNQ